MKTIQSGVILAIMGSSNLFGSFLKEIRDQKKAVLDTVSQVQDDARKLVKEVDLQTIADEVTTVKSAVTTTKDDLKTLDKKIKEDNLNA